MSGTYEELAGVRRSMIAQRRELKAGLTKLARDIAALDRVMSLVNPGHVPEAGHVNRRGMHGANPFGQGETTSTALASLRQIGRPATSAECADAMLKAKGVPTDEALRTRTANRVTALFSHKAVTGQVRRAGVGDGRQILWEIAR